MLIWFISEIHMNSQEPTFIRIIEWCSIYLGFMFALIADIGSGFVVLGHGTNYAV